ncbi:MAG: hypothetical protein ACTSQG_06825 [Promethearchaeota archaeon]
MANTDIINSIIILITLFIIFGIFLFYDLFRKNQKWGYLAYIAAVIPINYIWYLGFDVLGVYVLLFLLWDIILLRDLIIVYRKDKEYDDTILFLGLGILVQLVLTAILPAKQLFPSMQQGDHTYTLVNYFYLPDIYTESFSIEAWVDSTYLWGFRILATILVILLLIPMIFDVVSTEEEVPPIVVLILTGIFIIPFLFLSYIWVPQSIGVITPLFCVILFIILLLLTKKK